METLPEVPDTTKLSPELRAELLSNQTSLFMNPALFEHGLRVATMFSTTDMIPDVHKGKPGNCMIVLNVASRLQIDELLMFQNLHIIHGRPGLSGKLVAALINKSGKYQDPLKYQWLDAENNPIDDHKVYNDNKKDDRGCRAYTTDAKSGETVEGPKITWKIVHEEGWFGKSGSKWKTIPELMFTYRAASWFANKHCPEVTLGMQTVEEIKDFVDISKQPNGTYEASESDKAKVQELKKEMAPIRRLNPTMRSEDGKYGPDEIVPGGNNDPTLEKNWRHKRYSDDPTLGLHGYIVAQREAFLDAPGDVLFNLEAKYRKDYLEQERPVYHPWPLQLEAQEPPEEKQVEKEQENGSTGEDLQEAKRTYREWEKKSPEAWKAAHNNPGINFLAMPESEWGLAEYDIMNEEMAFQYRGAQEKE